MAERKEVVVAEVSCIARSVVYHFHHHCKKQWRSKCGSAQASDDNVQVIHDTINLVWSEEEEDGQPLRKKACTVPKIVDDDGVAIGSRVVDGTHSVHAQSSTKGKDIRSFFSHSSSASASTPAMKNGEEKSKLPARL